MDNAAHTLWDLGRIVREARRAQGLTQVELSKKARVSRSFIIGLERGTNQGAEVGRVFLVLKALGLRLVVEKNTSPTFEEALQDLLTQGFK
jgi:transcriptional regulator with XRE-family HTH domain